MIQYKFSLCDNINSITSFLSETDIHILDRGNNQFVFSINLSSDIIGIAIVYKIGKSDVSLRYLYIIPMFRDMGIGTNFIKYILSYFEKEISNRQFSIYYNSNCNLDYIESFFDKLKFPKAKYDNTIYKIRYNDYKEKVYPVYEHINFSQETIIKEYKDLTAQEKYQIKSISQKFDFDFAFSPFEERRDYIDRDIRLFYFNKYGDVVAWCYCTICGRTSFTIMMTYVIPEYRHFRYGLYVWSYLLQWCIKQGVAQEMSYISFDFDKRNTKLHHFYKRLLGDNLIEEKDNYIIRL